jgi:hypothetical protein
VIIKRIQFGYTKTKYNRYHHSLYYDGFWSAEFHFLPPMFLHIMKGKVSPMPNYHAMMMQSGHGGRAPCNLELRTRRR